VRPDVGQLADESEAMVSNSKSNFEENDDVDRGPVVARSGADPSVLYLGNERTRRVSDT